MPRGGFRKGAGAPRGNLNALKSGRYSAQLDAAFRTVVSREDIRPIFLAIMNKRRQENMRFHALVIATAKLVHNTNLTPEIVQRMADFLESQHPSGDGMAQGRLSHVDSRRFNRPVLYDPPHSRISLQGSRRGLPASGGGRSPFCRPEVRLGGGFQAEAPHLEEGVPLMVLGERVDRREVPSIENKYSIKPKVRLRLTRYGAPAPTAIMPRRSRRGTLCPPSLPPPATLILDPSDQFLRRPIQC